MILKAEEEDYNIVEQLDNEIIDSNYDRGELRHSLGGHGTIQFELEEDFDPDYPKKSKYGWASNRIPISRSQWLYLTIAQGLVPFIINFLINMFLTYVMFDKKEGAVIPFSGSLTCIVSDVVVTTFILPTISTITGAILVTLDLRKGKLIQPIDERWLHHTFFAWVPLGINYKIVIKRAILFGVFSVVLFAPITLAGIYRVLGHDGEMILKWSYYLFKGFWCAILALILSPIIAFIVVASYNPRHTFF